MQASSDPWLPSDARGAVGRPLHRVLCTVADAGAAWKDTHVVAQSDERLHGQEDAGFVTRLRDPDEGAGVESGRPCSL